MVVLRATGRDNKTAMIKKIKSLLGIEDVKPASKEPGVQVVQVVNTNEPETLFVPNSSWELFFAVNKYVEKYYHEPKPVPSDSSSDIRYSLKMEPPLGARLESLDGELVWLQDNKKAPTFSNEVKRIMEEKDIDPVALCARILMDRRLFSKLNTDVLYHPSKETAIAFCLGLELSYKEACVLLDRAGYSLSDFIKYDVVISFLLKNQIYDIDMINDVLYRYGLKCIGTSL